MKLVRRKNVLLQGGEHGNTPRPNPYSDHFGLPQFTDKSSSIGAPTLNRQAWSWMRRPSVLLLSWTSAWDGPGDREFDLESNLMVSRTIYISPSILSFPTLALEMPWQEHRKPGQALIRCSISHQPTYVNCVMYTKVWIQLLQYTLNP